MGTLLLVALFLCINLVLMWKLRTDDAVLQSYVKTSPSAFIWRKAFGEERAAEIIRTRVLPITALLWVVVLGSVAFEAFAR